MNVVITGGTKGIGRAIAETFAKAGDTIIVCARNEGDLSKMELEFCSAYGNNKFYSKSTDLEHQTQVKEFGQWLLEKELVPDVLVNNAGYFVPGSIITETDETFEKMMKINLHAAYHLTRIVLPAMIQRKSGHIFNICSVASFTPFANVGSYGISKFALLGFSKNLREELKEHGIKVTAVCPGATFTSSWEGSGIDEARIMEDEDVAKMVFAASQLSARAVAEDIILRPQLGDL